MQLCHVFFRRSDPVLERFIRLIFNYVLLVEQVVHQR